MTYLVQFDKTFLDGNLAGICVPGQVISALTRNRADYLARFYRGVEQRDDFMRDCVTGSRYKVSNVAVFLAAPPSDDPMGEHHGRNE